MVKFVSMGEHWYKAEKVSRIRNKEGIYAVYGIKNNSPELAYIGSSTYLYRRLKCHDVIPRIKEFYDSVYFKIKPVYDPYLEKELIKRIKPRFNRLYSRTINKNRLNKGTHKNKKDYSFNWY